MPAYDRSPIPVENVSDQSLPSRRLFLQGSAALTVGLPALVGALSLPPAMQASDSSLNILGLRPGYTPQVGTFISLSHVDA